MVHSKQTVSIRKIMVCGGVWRPLSLATLATIDKGPLKITTIVVTLREDMYDSRLETLDSRLQTVNS